MTASARTTFTLFREQSGLTIEEAAETLGMSLSQIYRYENGKCQPPPPVWKLLDKAGDARAAKESRPAFRFIDLFAGIGGLRLGFERIGGRYVYLQRVAIR